jgi:peptidoglycan/LPS O-acetylase OafA/YrhL
MFIGTFFYFWYNKEIIAKQLIILSVLGYICSQYNYKDIKFVISNFLAVIFFAYCLISVQWKNKIINQILAFFADISYPLYLIHLAVGYHVSIMLNLTYIQNPFLTFIISATVSIFIAFLLHKTLENRCNQFGKKLTFDQTIKR